VKGLVMNVVTVFVFGIFGGMARASLNGLFPSFYGFPLTTFCINCLGCFLLAFFAKNYMVSKNVSERLILGMGTGFIGSFTTFSSLILDAFKLYQNGEFAFLFLYLSGSLTLGFVMTILGFKIGRGCRK
jgi:CrcB protein